MAIRPVDLQLAYLAAPQNAAVVDSAQEAPAAAQQAAQASFAAQVTQREERVEQTAHAEGNRVRPRGEREPSQEGSARRERRAPQGYAACPLPQPCACHPEPQAGPLGLSGDGEHFIDVTA